MPKRKEKTARAKSMSVWTDIETIDEIERIMEETGKSRGEVIADAIAATRNDDEDDYKKPAILTVTSFKGGVAKTTTAANLGICLANYGHSVLLIDLDRQGSMSQYLRVYDPEAIKPCIADVLLSDKNGHRMKLEDVTVSTDFDNLDIVTSSFKFANADSAMKSESGVGLDMRLMYAIEDLNETKHYDFIIIDCPPELSLVVTNAITALEAGNKGSFIIVPVRPDGFSEYGMRDTINMIETVAKERRANPPKYYLLWTIIEPRTNVFKAAKQQIETRFKNVKFLNSRIDKSTKAAEASLGMYPLCEYDPSCKPAIQYNDLAAEVESMVYPDIEEGIKAISSSNDD